MRSVESRCDELQREGRLIVEHLGGHWTYEGGLCRCPAHADSNPSLSVRPGRKRLLFHCFAGCDVAAILAALAAARLLGRASAATAPSDCRLPARRNGAALRIWEEATSLAGTAAERYLAGRNIRTASPELRFHGRTPDGRGALARYRPALIAAVRDNGGIVAVQRTFLNVVDGEFRACSKRGLGDYGAGVVRLGGLGPVIGLAEGVETALSATALFGTPCWATLGAARFGRIRLPSSVAKVVLFLDHDAGGHHVEARARYAFPDRDVIARYPPRSGDDWNDVLQRNAKAKITAAD